MQPNQDSAGVIMEATPVQDQPLHACVIQLLARESGTLPATHGDLANAAFYAMIQAVEPEFAARLHAHEGRKGFTVSSLQANAAPSLNDLRLRAGNRYWFRITTMNGSLFDAFMQRLLAEVNIEMRLGPVPFLIEAVLGTTASHPWAGYSSTEALRQHVRETPRVRLAFVSPTTFSLKDKSDNGLHLYGLLPLPRLVWGSLRTSWNQIAGDDIPLAFEEWVERNVVVSEVRSWQTSLMRYRKATIPGGYGDVTYRCLDESSWRDTWSMLADFAFFSGVGYKTTQGMGQCRWYE